MKSAAAVRTHRRNKSGGGSRDLDTLNENDVATLDYTNSSPGHGVNKYVQDTLDICIFSVVTLNQ